MVTFNPRLSIRAPMEAEANPLPSDDTTPPVTKINLVLTPAMIPLRFQILFSFHQVFRSIDLHRSFHHVFSENPVAVNQSAQLLQALGLFEPCGSQPGESQQEIPAVYINAEMAMAPYFLARFSAVRRRHLVSRKRNRRPGKVQRELLTVANDFNDIRIAPLLLVIDLGTNRSHWNRQVAAERPNRARNRIVFDERQISLNVYDPVRFDLTRYFSQTIGTARVIPGRDDRFAAEIPDRFLNTSIISGHQHTSETAAPRCALVDMLDHRFTTDESQRFSRQSGRTIACRDDRHDRHGSQFRKSRFDQVESDRFERQKIKNRDGLGEDHHGISIYARLKIVSMKTGFPAKDATDGNNRMVSRV